MMTLTVDRLQEKEKLERRAEVVQKKLEKLEEMDEEVSWPPFQEK